MERAAISRAMIMAALNGAMSPRLKKIVMSQKIEITEKAATQMPKNSDGSSNAMRRFHYRDSALNF